MNERPAVPVAAVWADGVPVNLHAAAADALLWLDLLRTAVPPHLTEDRARLERCRAALRTHLGLFVAPRGPLVQSNVPEV